MMQKEHAKCHAYLNNEKKRKGKKKFGKWKIEK